MNKNKTGFTLIELLAVIAILAIILLIAVPIIMNILNNIKISAFESQVRLIIDGMNTESAKDNSFDPTTVTQDNIDDLLGIDNTNIDYIGVDEENDVISVEVIGANTWEDLVVTGTINNLSSRSGITSHNKYAMIEIPYEYQTATNQITFTDVDESQQSINLGFNIQIGANLYSTIYVGTNGTITFDSGVNYDSSNVSIDQFNLTNPVIALYWNDLTADTNYFADSGVYYTIGTENSLDYILIEYRNIFDYTISYDEENAGNFEAKIYSDGTIKMSYQDAIFGDGINYGGNGFDASIGVYVNPTYQYMFTYSDWEFILGQNYLQNKTFKYYISKGVSIDNDCYGYANNTHSIVYYNETTCSTTVNIPSNINGRIVSTIGGSAFYNKGIDAVTIPYTLTKIGESAFQNNVITSVVIPSSVITMDESAFAYNLISSLSLPDNMTSISRNAFTDNQLTTVTLPPNLKYLNDGAFNNNPITNITLPNSLITIGSTVFQSNLLPSITIPSTVTTIGSYAFFGNQLSTITIPSSVTSLGDRAFYGNNMTSATLSQGLQTIGVETFASNLLASINIPEGVTSIGIDAFRNNQLSSISLPSTLTFIDASAFANNQMTGSGAFIYNRNGDGSINTASLNSYAGASRGSITIPSGVTTISPYSFKSCNITSVTIPSTVTLIGYQAFSNNSLTTISIPSSVTTIDTSAFEYNSLASVTLANGITTINQAAFSHNVITSVAIPNSVTTIRLYAFRYNKIPQGSLTIDRASGTVTIGTSAFAYNGVNSNVTITPVYLR